MDIKRTIAFSGRDLKALSITGKSDKDDQDVTRSVQPHRYKKEDDKEYFLCFQLGNEKEEYQYSLDEISDIKLLDEAFEPFPGVTIYV